MEFKVIKGGKAKDSKIEYRFVEGCASDTRLMGVLGLHLHYLKDIEDVGVFHIHCFLYYDIEEIGLDSVKLLQLSSSEEADRAEKASFGGLGAKMISVNEAEALYLVKWFVDGTVEKKRALPEEITDISFIIDIISKTENNLSLVQIDALNHKLCTEIHNDYGLINYCIMRCIGRDFNGARLLCDESVSDEKLQGLSFKNPGTFLQNNIEKFVDENGCESYLCQSLVDTDNSYNMLQSELVIENGKIVMVEKLSVMPVSIEEASFMLSTAEYVNVYEIMDWEEDPDYSFFDDDFEEYCIGFTRTRHETGTMYMQFFDNNLHAEKQKFNLSDDVKAIYYVSDYGQLIVGAYSQKDIDDTESALSDSDVALDIASTAKYQFTQSVIYEFAISGMIDFEEFIQLNEL